MSEVWGKNDPADKKNQDLVSDPQYHNILKVNDVNNNDDAKKAAEFINSSTNANARALKVEGKSEFDGNIFTTESSYATLKINDVNEDNDAKVAIHTINSSQNSGSRALKVEGQVEITTPSEGHVIGIQVTNESAADLAAAIQVNEGETKLNGPLRIYNSFIMLHPGSSLHVREFNTDDAAIVTQNFNTGSQARALKAEGSVEVIAVSEENPATTGLIVRNDSTNPSALALEVTGKSELTGNVDVDGDVDIDAGHTLKVNDLNSAGNAVESTNSGAGNALKINGKSELTGNVDVDGNIDIDAGHTLKVNDLNSAGNAVESTNSGAGNALKINGKSDLNGDVEVSGGTLEVSGHNVLTVDDVNEGDDAKIALQTTNSSSNLNSRALKVDGNAQFNDLLVHPTDEGAYGRMYVDTTGCADLRIGNQPTSGKIYIGDTGRELDLEATPLRLLGSVRIPALDSDSDDLEIGTSDSLTSDTILSCSGHATKVQGSLEVDEAVSLNDELTVADALTAEGLLTAEGHLKVGPSDSAGEIDSGGSAGSKQDLKIGTGAGTDDVIIAKQDQTTIIDCNLRVGRSQVGMVHASRIDAYGNAGNPDVLHIGTQSHTTGVAISRTGTLTHVYGSMEINEGLKIGTSESDGLIDCNAAPEGDSDLKLGTLDNTRNVIIGRADHDVNVADDLNVGGDCAVVGGLHVGPEADAGMIDAGGDIAIPQDLKVGTGVGTQDVKIGRAGQTLDIFAQARANGNSVILNNAASITAGTGCGLLYNADGQGALEPSIDFYINGACVYYIDSAGGHNV